MFCVYLTVYSGKLLPPFYIGSTSKKRIEKGYRGSVCSKRYGKLWKEELRNNPQLFTIKILSEWDTRELAYEEELRIQLEYNVVKNPDYVNLTLAKNNKFFGIGLSGESHYSFGKTKENCKSLAKLSESLKDRTKDNNENVAKMAKKRSKTMTGQTKENCERVRKQAAKLNILTNEETKELLDLKSKKISHKDIQEYFNNKGISIAYSSISTIYQREKKCQIS